MGPTRSIARQMLLAAEEPPRRQVALWRPLPKERPRLAQKSISRSPKEDVLGASLRHHGSTEDAYLRHSRRYSPISRGRERLQLRRRRALAREVIQRHQGL